MKARIKKYELVVSQRLSKKEKEQSIRSNRKTSLSSFNEFKSKVLLTDQEEIIALHSRQKEAKSKYQAFVKSYQETANFILDKIAQKNCFA